MGLPLMEMDVWWSCNVSCMIFSRKKLNKMSEISISDEHLLLS